VITEGTASNVVDAVKLGRQLASEAQMSEEGTAIVGAGTDTDLRQAERLAQQYGGSSIDYMKMTSSSYQGSDGFQFETHWYQNGDGGIFEPKTKFPDNSNVGYK